MLSNSSRLSVSSRRPEDVKMPRLALYTEEDGVEITLGTENYLFSLFCMTNSFNNNNVYYLCSAN